MTSEKLKEIRVRLAAATIGPWKHGYNDDYEGWIVTTDHNKDKEVSMNWYVAHMANVSPKTSPDEVEANAIFFANAPTDMADLLTQNAELSADNRRLRVLLCDYSRHSHECEATFLTPTDYKCSCGYDEKVLPIVSALSPDVPESEEV